MFDLKSLVSYYRDLLFCLYYCLNLRNRDICNVSEKKNSVRVFLQTVELVECVPHMTDEKWITVTLTQLATNVKDPGE